MNANETSSRPAPARPDTIVETRRAVLLGAGALLLSGCVVAPLGPAHGRYPYRGDVGPETDTPPPPARYEAVPVAPGPLHVWIAGYWTWQLGRHVWVSGRWTLPPRGHTWAPGYWDRRGSRWRWHGGHWRRR